MTDYKDKYMRAVKELDEAEKEAADSIQALYQVLVSILKELKGHHGEVDQAISALPSKIPANGEPPNEELARIRDLIVSFFDKKADISVALSILDALLSNLKVSDDLHDGAETLQASLTQAKTPKELIAIVQKTASIVLRASSLNNSSLARGSIADIKQGLTFQLAQLEELDVELAKSIDLTSLLGCLEKVGNIKDLDNFYKQIFESLGESLAKKNQFIVELSGLIETVVHQLSELSSDLKHEGNHDLEARKDRWRLTELMGGQIDTLQDSVLQTENLSTLKLLLTERLGEFNQTVSEFAELEESRANQAEEYALSVANSLKRLESEASDLKLSLHQAHEEALIDVLTGIANRRAFDERIRLEFERWKRNKEALVLAVLDIDHFKNINDTYGHSIGDKVLCTIAQLIDKQVRDSDFFGRVGGEEFAVIFTGSDLKNAVKRLNQFRKSIEGCKFGYKGKRITITVSVGCALFGEGDNPDSAYERADQALYKAKQAGRNICFSERDL